MATELGVCTLLIIILTETLFEGCLNICETSSQSQTTFIKTYVAISAGAITVVVNC